MYFSDLDSMLDNKQRLNLSDRAYTVLKNDADILHAAGVTPNVGGDVSSFIINHIFESYCDDAQVSIASSLRKKKEELSRVLSQLDTDEQNVVIQTILEDYQEQLVKKAQSYLKEKGHVIALRVNQRCIDYLSSDEGQAEGRYYEDRIGLYIKAVIEEYCALPYVERERYFCGETLQEIQLALSSTAADKPQRLKLTLHSKRATDNSGYAHNVMYVKPLFVQVDAENMYHYLVGLISTSSDGPWKPGSLRLTSIKKCVRQSAVHISQVEKKRVMDEVQTLGVQFLSSNNGSERIVVQLSSQGQAMYKKLLHLRPMYAEKKDNGIYVFFCSSYQAESYFFKYGPDARIIEPEALATRFKNRYQEALCRYY